MQYFSHISHELLELAKPIRVLVTDLDGVLTDGSIILDDNGMEYKSFQVKDGQILHYLREAKIQVGVLSGRDVAVSKKRCEQMNVDFHRHGLKDKWGALSEILSEKGIQTAEVAYIGDDLIDLDLLRRVGFSAAPSDAMPYILDNVHYVCKKQGGKGVFREVADLILYAQGKLPDLLYGRSAAGAVGTNPTNDE
ncbi:KdsC family phosphatase [Cyclobacterium xiamenense]|uniref:KdsC family phosphatase n=1 Tax=Cyclobacterium xiamenense TaxID=1297121 RepID=UPI0035CEB395